jgi:PilZ domain
MTDNDQNRSFTGDPTSDPSGDLRPEKRDSTRVKVSVPVELFAPDSDVPHRGATSDLSETGCYIESIFPFPIGTIFEMRLQLDGTLLALGTVVTCDPQVGNGIKFTKMLPEDQEELRAYVEAARQAKDKP